MSPNFPGLLVAPPSMQDPNFQKSVVALATHEAAGAIGYNISRTANVSFHELLDNLSIRPKISDQMVLVGGPVSEYSGFIAYRHRINRPRAPGMPLCREVSITPARQVLEDAAAGKIKTFELILGYSGWGPAQLDKEISQGQWIRAPFYPEILADVPVSERWNYVFERMGISPYNFMNVPGGAQA